MFIQKLLALIFGEIDIINIGIDVHMIAKELIWHLLCIQAEENYSVGVIKLIGGLPVLNPVIIREIDSYQCILHLASKTVLWQELFVIHWGLDGAIAQ